MDGDAIVTLIITILTFISFLCGVWKYWWEVAQAAATKDISRACEDSDEIGYFTTFVPRWQICPFCITRLESPRIPSLWSIIKLGDLGLFTASIMDNGALQHLLAAIIREVLQRVCLDNGSCRHEQRMSP